MIVYLIITIGIFIYIGFILGKKFPKIPWKKLILPIIPWIIFGKILEKKVNVGFGEAGILVLFWYIILLVYLIFLIAIRFGVWAAKEKDATTKIIISE